MSPYLKVHKLHPMLLFFQIRMLLGYNLSRENCRFACAEWDILVVSKKDFPDGKKKKGHSLNILSCVLEKTFLSRSRT
jgi:hypothetical protein